MKNYKGFNPKRLSSNVWYYLTKDSIDLIHEIWHDNKYVRTDQIKIPLRGILNALKKGK
jgi:hypothetical protein